MDTWIIVVALAVYIPAAVITDLPIIFDKQKYTMDYIMLFIGLLPVFNVFTAGFCVMTCQDDWKAIFNKLGIKKKEK